VSAALALVPLVAFTGILGLVIGSFLNVVAYRVPAGVSLLRESRCPTCDSPVRWWQNVPVVSWMLLRGRCASCRAPISARYPVVELATGIVFAVVGAWWALATGLFSGPALPPLPAVADGLTTLTQARPFSGPVAAQLLVLAAYLWFAASSVVLTVIDLDTRRLPHAITGSALGVCLALLGVACILGADWSALARAAIGAIGLYLFYALLRFIRPDGMGGGDVRLAAVVGLMLGWLGWWPLIFGAFAAFVLGGVFGVALLVGGRAGRRSAIPFGPWILAGAWVGVFAGEVLGRWYASLYGGL
jgi:leader peptidase (prepilin peptidase)/N-methyltransferase